MYQFYLNDDLLPIAPEKLNIKTNSSNEIITIVSQGDYNILKDIGLKDINFKVLLPGKPYHFIATLDNYQKPIYYLDKIRVYKENKEPIRLIITRTMQTGADIFTTNILAAIQDYDIDEEAGEEGDIYLNIKLREHREPTLVTTQVVNNDTETGVVEVVQIVERPAKQTPNEHRVVSGDTLWSIAKRKLNNGSRYREIAQLNNIQNPNLIFPGQVLKLPT